MSAKKQPRKNLTATLYCYVEVDNAAYAKKEGKALFGSFSAYVNALIARDRGVTPRLGTWKAPGESRALRRKSKRTIVNLRDDPDDGDDRQMFLPEFMK